MGKNRLEAFSDGVIAILITIMVLELKVPHGATIEALLPLWPVFLSYVLSFVYIGIYWNNHHHMLHAVREVSGGVLWANLHLLFWISLVPFVTVPVATYGLVLFMSSLAYLLLEQRLIAHSDRNAALARAVGSDRKTKISILLYLVGVGLSFIWSWLGFAVYIGVAIIWLVPDRRIEERVSE
jgi:uncharacterized membrane protein